ncbi:DNA ligase IV [Cavenderia fasciculata]|uniref:DNA ligase 4 n=1 Tax=Cavenderia fasciculata TaxID=261658 RepID=F4PGQ7_CACFS|nr:DNA ligase IV [Cavenderia fasciculata]EGG24891.1 DNA ligase IV [Cavenderia fasciculata]|eukprot:XP_004362742.1 DNA ligase IV [Cavenderia fasciculata]
MLSLHYDEDDDDNNNDDYGGATINDDINQRLTSRIPVQAPIQLSLEYDDDDDDDNDNDKIVFRYQTTSNTPIKTPPPPSSSPFTPSKTINNNNNNNHNIVNSNSNSKPNNNNDNVFKMPIGPPTKKPQQQQVITTKTNGNGIGNGSRGKRDPGLKFNEENLSKLDAKIFDDDDDDDSYLVAAAAASTTTSTTSTTTTTDQQQTNNTTTDQQPVNNYDYQKTVPFSIFCELLERVSKDSKHTDKKKHLSKFFSNYKDNNFFPLLRLFLPHLDKERQTYGLKEKTLAKFYVEILGISPTSLDATRLVNWKKSTNDEIGGDFGMSVYLSLRNRCIQKGRLSMGDVNISLDHLNKSMDRKEKLRVLKRVLRYTTCLEQKWFVRIILKEMKMGLSEKTVLNFFHSDAMAMFNVSCNLRKVCEDLSDARRLYGSGNTGGFVTDPSKITLFQPIKPMLADRKPMDSVMKVLGDHPFMVETKKDKWIKIKPEYLDGVGDDLDLVIIGGYYGSGVGRRGGTVSHFMLGVQVKDPDLQLSNSSSDTPLFYSFCKVGSGYSDEELKKLQKALEPHWMPYRTSSPPSHILLAEPHREKPDLWIDPRVSKVLQIKAAQILPTEKYRTGYTLRFPRVIKIRDDKPWDECLDFGAMLSLATEFEGRYAKRKYTMGDDGDGDGGGGGGGRKTKRKKKTNPDGTPIASTAKGKKKTTLLSIFQDTDTSHILPSNNIFMGVEFCVINGDSRTSLVASKARLETLIVENGGTKVQYPSPATTKYVVSSREVVKIQNLIHDGHFDIVHYQWLLDCIQEGKVLPLSPKYMIYTTNKTKQLLLQDIDRFGDSFTQDTTVDELLDSFNQITKQKVQTSSNVPFIIPSNLEIKSSKQIQQIESKYMTTKEDGEDGEDRVEDFKPNSNWWSLFRGITIYLDRYNVIGEESTITESNTMELVSHLLTFYGGVVTSQFDDNLDYVVVDSSDSTRLQFINTKIKRLKSENEKTVEIVSVKWIKQCIVEKMILSHDTLLSE